MRSILRFVNIWPAALLIVCLTSCATPRHHDTHPEPALFIYHVKPGSEKALEAVLQHAWEVCRRGGMVLRQPHICWRDAEDGGTVVVEAFMWAGPFVTEWPGEEYNRLRRQMDSLCEERGGHSGVDERQPEIFIP